MKRVPKNPNDHKIVTPQTKEESDDSTFTSYDTSKKETSSPQKVRESRESAGEHDRAKKQKG